MQELTVEKSSTRKIHCPIAVGEAIPPVPAMLQRALESVWVDAVRKAQGIPEEGFAGMVSAPLQNSPGSTGPDSPGQPVRA